MSLQNRIQAIACTINCGTPAGLGSAVTADSAATPLVLPSPEATLLKLPLSNSSGYETRGVHRPRVAVASYCHATRPTRTRLAEFACLFSAPCRNLGLCPQSWGRTVVAYDQRQIRLTSRRSTIAKHALNSCKIQSCGMCSLASTGQVEADAGWRDGDRLKRFWSRTTTEGESFRPPMRTTSFLF